MSSKITSFLELSDEVSKDVDKAVKEFLGDKPYDSTQVPEWVDSITNNIVGKLTARCEDFKYIISVVILEKKNGGFHLFSTCYWDQEQDGTVTVRWDNKTMHCVVTVFGVTLD